MRCDRVQTLLSAYVDGELPRGQAAQIARHLTGCPACEAERRALARLAGALQAIPEEPPPAGLHSAIMQALDGARPTLWQRLCAATVPLQPARPLALGSLAAGCIALLVAGGPLHRGELERAPARRIAYRIPTEPVLPPAPSPAEAALPQSPVPAADVKPVEPEPVLPSAPPESAEKKLVLAAAPAPSPPQRAPRRRRPGRTAPVVSGPRQPRTPPMRAFDPLAPAVDPNAGPMDPPMTNLVVAEPPPSMQPGESMMMASMPGGSELATASPPADDLAALRQRRAQEPIELPPVRFEAGRRRSKPRPLIRGEF